MGSWQPGVGFWVVSAGWAERVGWWGVGGLGVGRKGLAFTRWIRVCPLSSGVFFFRVFVFSGAFHGERSTCLCPWGWLGGCGFLHEVYLGFWVYGLWLILFWLPLLGVPLPIDIISVQGLLGWGASLRVLCLLSPASGFGLCFGCFRPPTFPRTCCVLFPSWLPPRVA